MLLNSYLWKKGIKKNRFSNDLDDMKSIIPRTSLNEISFMQNILLEETKVEIKNINLSRGGTVVLMPDSNVEGGEEEPVVEEKEEEEEEPVVEEKEEEEPVVEEKEEEPVVEEKEEEPVVEEEEEPVVEEEEEPVVEEEEEPVVEEEEPVVEEKEEEEEEHVIEGGNESEGGFMELEEGPPEDIGIDEPILPPSNEGGDSDIKHVVVTKFF